MTTPMGHLIPSPERPRVPYLVNEPGDAGQILHLDANEQQEWTDIEGTVYPAGGNLYESLQSNGFGGVLWGHAPVFTRQGVIGLPAEFGLPDDVKDVDVQLQLRNITGLGTLTMKLHDTGTYDGFVSNDGVITPLNGAATIPLVTLTLAGSIAVSMFVRLSNMSSYTLITITGSVWEPTTATIQEFTVQGSMDVGLVDYITIAGTAALTFADLTGTHLSW